MKTLNFLLLWGIVFLIPSNTLISQCYPDRHNTSLNSMWISCDKSENPNPDRPEGYWVLFELEELQAIQSLKIWNLNHPDHLDNGVKQIEIDYQAENGNWEALSIHSINKAEASGFYEGEEIQLPGEFVADKILFNFTENHGGDCYGLAEIRLGLINKTTSTKELSIESLEIEMTPNPFSEQSVITLRGLTGSSVRYEVSNIMGQVVITDKVPNPQGGSNEFILAGQNIPAGTYYLRVMEKNRISTKNLR